MFWPAARRKWHSNAVAGEEYMRLLNSGDARYRLALAGLGIIGSLHCAPLMSYAQNLEQQPAVGQAVQGETVAQPEGTVLKLVNWVGNVIALVGAALAVVMAVIAYSQGRGVMRWSVTAAGLPVISGLCISPLLFVGVWTVQSSIIKFMSLW
jgi:hypothetical protein